MDWDLWNFITVVIFVFALVMVIAGIFSAYFGAGKSKTYGVVIFIVGLVVGLIWAYLVGYSDIEPFSSVPAWDVIYNTILNVVAVAIGALIAVGIFLAAVLKN